MKLASIYIAALALVPGAPADYTYCDIRIINGNVSPNVVAIETCVPSGNPFPVKQNNPKTCATGGGSKPGGSGGKPGISGSKTGVSGNRRGGGGSRTGGGGGSRRGGGSRNRGH
ncbi:hypothetical protein PspLS_03271 [Pyricularia sp. CBS 133598]|nr:hypothetical protein PspLS_03271 [Pyricularia sp. CBS 133598]